MQKLHRKFSAAAAWQTFVLSICGILVVGLFDWVTGNEISFAIFYLLPICFAALYAGFELGVIVCLIAAGAWLAADTFAADRHEYSFTPVWNALVRLSFFLIITYLLTRLRALTENLEVLVQRRTSALEAEITERKCVQAEMADLEDKQLRRLSQELHDRVGSYLAGIAFRAKTLSQDLDSRNAPEKSRATELVKLINTSITNVRNISRLLTPIEREHQDLKSALSRLSAEMETCFGITCSFEAPNDLPALEHEAAEQLCRIAQEAVRNAIQHAHPTTIEVRLRIEAGLLRLTVQNDGKTWDPAGSSRKRGLGLRIMRNRAERIGGKFLINIGVQGGTCVQCDIPLNNPDPSLQTVARPAPLPPEIIKAISSGVSNLRPELPRLTITRPSPESLSDRLPNRAGYTRLTRRKSKAAPEKSQDAG